MSKTIQQCQKEFYTSHGIAPVLISVCSITTKELTSFLRIMMSPAPVDGRDDHEDDHVGHQLLPHQFPQRGTPSTRSFQ